MSDVFYWKTFCICLVNSCQHPHFHLLQTNTASVVVHSNKQKYPPFSLLCNVVYQYCTVFRVLLTTIENWMLFRRLQMRFQVKLEIRYVNFVQSLQYVDFIHFIQLALELVCITVFIHIVSLYSLHFHYVEVALFWQQNSAIFELCCSPIVLLTLLQLCCSNLPLVLLSCDNVT